MARTKRVKMPNPTVPGRYTTRGWKKSAPEYPPYITEQRQWDGKGWSGREDIEVFHWVASEPSG